MDLLATQGPLGVFPWWGFNFLYYCTPWFMFSTFSCSPLAFSTGHRWSKFDLFIVSLGHIVQNKTCINQLDKIRRWLNIKYLVKLSPFNKRHKMWIWIILYKHWGMLYVNITLMCKADIFLLNMRCAFFCIVWRNERKDITVISMLYKWIHCNF